jgi:cell wall-associated NlpC family hydrolase
MVRPPRAVTAVALADIHAEPRDDSELVDQSVHGERLAVLGRRDGWLWVQGEDHYFGWVPGGDVRPVAPAAGELVVTVVGAALRPEPRASAPAVGLLPAGAILREWRREGDWVGTSLGWVRSDQLVAREALPQRVPTPDDLVATALVFFATPYLWGGTTAAGIDCSGLVQQVYRLNGVGLDRDADQQALGGRAVDTPRTGDLLFFGSPSVTHVALSLGGDEFIHAPLRGATVERRRTGPDRTPVSIRRYLVGDEA